MTKIKNLISPCDIVVYYDSQATRTVHNANMPKPISNDYIVQRWDQVLSGNLRVWEEYDYNPACKHNEKYIREFVDHAKTLITPSSRNVWYAIPAVNAALHVGRQEIQRGLKVVTIQREWRPYKETTAHWWTNEMRNVSITRYHERHDTETRRISDSIDKKIGRAYANMESACRNALDATRKLEELELQRKAVEKAPRGKASPGVEESDADKLRKQVAHLTRMVKSMQNGRKRRPRKP